MPQTLILAKSTTEANRYAKVAGLDRFTYRAVRSAGSIRGVRHAEVHLLTSFLKRLDRHAILGALRWARTLEVYYVDFRDGEIRDGTNDPSTYADDGFDLLESHDVFGLELTDHDLEVAYRYNAIRDLEGTSGEETGETEPSEDPAPVAPRRRRSRCAKCSQLHFKDEACVEPDPDEQRADTNGFAPRPSVDDFFA